MDLPVAIMDMQQSFAGMGPYNLGLISRDPSTFANGLVN